MFITIDVYSEYQDDLLVDKTVVINHQDDKQPVRMTDAYVYVDGNVVEVRTNSIDNLLRRYVNVPVLVRYHEQQVVPV